MRLSTDAEGAYHFSSIVLRAGTLEAKEAGQGNEATG
jgi:hypothetical protein